MSRPVLLGILLVLILASFWPREADGAKTAGTLSIKFLNYTNPKGTLANGNWCDWRWIRQPHGCDYKFKICLDRPPLDSNIRSCRIGRKDSTEEIDNHDSVVFGSTIGNLVNPVKFDLTSQHFKTGSAALKVQVWDDDPGINKNDFVDLVSTTINLRRQVPQVYTLKSRTKLFVLTTTKCAGFRHGPACDMYCKARDDVGGHYTCAPITGKKICIKGWKGSDCKTREIPIDYCAGKPCRNRARCLNSDTGPKCDCRYAYTGRYCERHRCEQTCLPGRCSYSGYLLPTCTCPVGYTSQKAIINFKKIYILPKCVKSVTSATTRQPRPTPKVKTTVFVPETTTSQKTTVVPFRNDDCSAFARRGDYESDTFIIKVKGIPEFRAWCDIKGDAGWTLIQRRVDDSVSFNRNWADYKKGFGVLGRNTNYWMGLEKLHHLTTQKDYKLQVVFWETKSDKRSYKREATYERFWVDSEANKYRLHVSGYSGDAGDALGYHNGEAFSTPDRDNDKLKWGGNCAKLYGSGWWFKRCYRANLNGLYPNPKNKKPFPRSYHKITWLSKKGSFITRVTMKVTPIVGNGMDVEALSLNDEPPWRQLLRAG